MRRAPQLSGRRRTLVLQARGRDHEVDDADFDRGLRRVERVAQLGRDVKAEVVGELNGGISEPKHVHAALLEDLFEKMLQQSLILLLMLYLPYFALLHLSSIYREETYLPQ